MSTTIDVQLPQHHSWSQQYLPALVGQQWWLGVTVEGVETQRPATVIGVVRLPHDIGGIVMKLEIT